MDEFVSVFAPGRRLNVVIDTDTFNEIDDQFALVYALLSPERMGVEAIYAAPFQNDRVSSYGEGMELSYQEILRVIGLLGLSGAGAVFRGATVRMGGTQSAGSVASDDLIRRANAVSAGDRLVVIAIGAATNVAAALQEAPEIAEKIVVLWLGGHPSHWAHNHEFNLKGDPEAVRVMMDSRVPFGWFPCATVAESLTTTVSELKLNLVGQGEIGDYLFDIFENYDHEDLRAMAASKTIWDLAPFAWAIDPSWFDVRESSRPVLSEEFAWEEKEHRGLLMEAIRLRRDPIFRDFFSKVQAFKAGQIVPRIVDTEIV